MKAGLKYKFGGASGKKQNSGGRKARRCLRIYFKR